MQKEEYLIKNACYSVTKYYLCKQNNKRSLLGRKQRSQVARSFPNRYQFSCTNKVTSLFSISCILRIILAFNCGSFANSKGQNGKSERLSQGSKSRFPIWLESFRGSVFVKVVRHHVALLIGISGTVGASTVSRTRKRDAPGALSSCVPCLLLPSFVTWIIASCQTLNAHRRSFC